MGFNPTSTRRAFEDVGQDPTLRLLVRRGMVVIDAKHAIEAVVEHRRAVVEVPMVEDTDVLARDLAVAGFSAEIMARLPQPAQAS